LPASGSNQNNALAGYFSIRLKILLDFFMNDHTGLSFTAVFSSLIQAFRKAAFLFEVLCLGGIGGGFGVNVFNGQGGRCGRSILSILSIPIGNFLYPPDYFLGSRAAPVN